MKGFSFCKNEADSFYTVKFTFVPIKYAANIFLHQGSGSTSHGTSMSQRPATTLHLISLKRL
jgi:hypothetical protein